MHKWKQNAFFGRTPLGLAADSGYTKCVKRLLSSGANIEAQNDKGHTPLVLAIIQGHTKCVNVLLKAGAKIDDNALIQAAKNGFETILKLLIKHGADVKLSDKKLQTAMHIVAHFGI